MRHESGQVSFATRLIIVQTLGSSLSSYRSCGVLVRYSSVSDAAQIAFYLYIATGFLKCGDMARPDISQPLSKVLEFQSMRALGQYDEVAAKLHVRAAPLLLDQRVRMD